MQRLSMKSSTSGKGSMSDKEKKIWSNGDLGQGDKLMQAKKKHDKKLK